MVPAMLDATPVLITVHEFDHVGVFRDRHSGIADFNLRGGRWGHGEDPQESCNRDPPKMSIQCIVFHGVPPLTGILAALPDTLFLFNTFDKREAVLGSVDEGRRRQLSVVVHLPCSAPPRLQSPP